MKVGKMIYFDDVKDKDLMEWLDKKNGRSAYIRIILYDKMREENLGLIKSLIPYTTTNAVTNPPVDNNQVSKKSFLSAFKR